MRKRTKSVLSAVMESSLQDKNATTETNKAAEIAGCSQDINAKMRKRTKSVLSAVMESSLQDKNATTETNKAVLTVNWHQVTTGTKTKRASIQNVETELLFLDKNVIMETNKDV